MQNNYFEFINTHLFHHWKYRKNIENELLSDMYDYLKSPAGQSFKTKIQSIQGSSVKIRAAQESRTYKPRQRNDLTITDKHSTANKPFEEMLVEFNRNKPYMQGGKMRK